MDQKLTLVLTAEIRSGEYGSQGLKFAEQVELEPRDFLELCKILAAFHDLAESLKRTARR